MSNQLSTVPQSRPDDRVEGQGNPARPGGLFSRLLVPACVLAIFASTSFGQVFHDVTSEVGLVMELKKSWGNPIWGDINNDGYPDLIVPTHGLLLSRGPFVYLNNAGQSFTDIRATSGIERNNPDSSDWHGFAFGDYDGDGNLDLYVAEGAQDGTKNKSDELFRGHGDGTFEYASRTAGIEVSNNRGRCSFWFDCDNDGRLDLFVKNYAGFNRLYHNKGDGTFSLVANAGGLKKATETDGLGTICSFADYDNDGYMDVFFTGDQATDTLYRNLGNGTFVDVTAASGIESLDTGHGIAWGDYNNDGLLDVYITRGSLNPDGNKFDSLYRNNGDGTFTGVTVEAGLDTTQETWAAVWGDYDNDGYLDLFLTNAGVNSLGPGNANFLYHNNGDGTFTNRAVEAGVALQDNASLHKGAAWEDYNNDGFLDLLVKDGLGNEGGSGPGAVGLHRLFKNGGNSNGFIKVNLIGVESNKLGIGARVTVAFDGMICMRANNGGGGGEYASQGSGPLHFGLGRARTATVVVNWPSGIVDTITSVTARSTITVTEGTHP